MFIFMRVGIHTHTHARTLASIPLSRILRVGAKYLMCRWKVDVGQIHNVCDTLPLRHAGPLVKSVARARKTDMYHNRARNSAR